MYPRLCVPTFRAVIGCPPQGLVVRNEMGGSMSFSLPRFLRHIRSSDLGAYFEQRDIRFPEPLDWNVVPVKLLACLKAAI
jgi:hypothetical protein